MDVLKQQSTDAKPKLLDVARGILRAKHYSLKTEQSYLRWMKRYILFHNKRHPKEMGENEISQFLTHLAVQGHVAASTQNQALCAIVFLYKHVLKKEIGELELTWAKRPQRLPEVFTPEETAQVLRHLKNVYWLMGVLMYGAGLRVMECLRLRVKDRGAFA